MILIWHDTLDTGSANEIKKKKKSMRKKKVDILILVANT